MPFIHLHVGQGGMAKACCVANIPFGNVNEKTMEEIWHGESINKLRDKFNNGETDNRCMVCHNREAAGAKSLRQETFEKFKAVDLERASHIGPVYFDIRFSNVCNLRCRTCWHGASSKWYADAKILGQNIGRKAIIQNINDLELFIEKYGNALRHAEEFYFAGGEPLVTEEHYVLLNYLIKHGATKARLRYNTNFSTLDFKGYRVLDLWNQFEEVEVLASLDAASKLGQYLRKDLDWSQVLKNRVRLAESSPHVKFKIAPTISVLNIANVPSFYQRMCFEGIIETEDLYVNILERPTYYNIQILPPEIKDKIAHRFFEVMEEHLPLSIKKAFQEILDYMWLEDRSSVWPIFLEKTNTLDKIREENWKDHLPLFS